MSIKTDTVTLQKGTRLHFKYDTSENRDQVCGTVSYYQAIEDQLLYQALEYYTTSAYSNKFFTKVDFYIYSPMAPIQYPEHGAYTFDMGSGKSEVHSKFYPNPPYDGYIMPAFTSHEFGHAYHNWTECFSTLGHAWTPFFKQLFKPSDPNSLTNVVEQFANTYRVLLGTQSTRGVAGPNTREPLEPGIENPNDHPDWKKMFQIMPETCAMMKTYGVKVNTLSWNGWCFMFQLGSGHWVYQDDYYSWNFWDGYKWVKWYPTYTRS